MLNLYDSQSLIKCDNSQYGVMPKIICGVGSAHNGVKAHLAYASSTIHIPTHIRLICQVP